MCTILIYNYPCIKRHVPSIWAHQVMDVTSIDMFQILRFFILFRNTLYLLLTHVPFSFAFQVRTFTCTVHSQIWQFSPLVSYTFSYSHISHLYICETDQKDLLGPIPSSPVNKLSQSLDSESLWAEPRL